MPWPRYMCVCRFNGKCQANFATTIDVISAVVAMPFSTRRGGALACTTAPSQDRQPYRGRRIRLTCSTAGITSSCSLTSSPIICIAPPQQGQTVLSGSITISQRGRCFGNAPMLRAALGRDARSLAGSATPSSLAAAGTSLTSFSSSRNCALSTTRSFSERGPNTARLNVATTASRCELRSCRSTMISISRSGSRGRVA